MISRACALVLGPALLLGACTASSEEVRPPEDELFFPTGLAMSPDDRFLFVTSANSDLRYDSGTIQSIDVETVDAFVTAFRDTGAIDAACAVDLDGSGALECDERAFFVPSGRVRVGNFATTIGVQDKGGGNLRLLVPVRGDPSVTFAEWDGTARALTCGGGQGFELCDDSHRLTRMRNDEDLPELPDEPYGIYVDSVAQYAAVTHLRSGTVSLVDSPAAGTPILSDAIGGLFNGTSPGTTGIAGRLPGPNNILYVQSRVEDRIQTLTVARQNGGPAFLVPSSYFFLNEVGLGAAGSSTDSRGVVFDAAGDRAYMINRSPPSLMTYDTSIGTGGAPQNQFVTATDICREASSLVLADGGEGNRVYISCFQSGELYVVDPRGISRVEAVTTVGRGPFSVAAAASRQLLFISTFLDDAIAVVDIDPASPTVNRVVLRIGARS
jgi:DNA-binding beta-propeller fold protein YncE